MNASAIITEMKKIADLIGCSEIFPSVDGDGIILRFIIGESKFQKPVENKKPEIITVPITTQRKISFSAAKAYITAFKIVDK